MEGHRSPGIFQAFVRACPVASGRCMRCVRRIGCFHVVVPVVRLFQSLLVVLEIAQ